MIRSCILVLIFGAIGCASSDSGADRGAADAAVPGTGGIGAGGSDAGADTSSAATGGSAPTGGNGPAAGGSGGGTPSTGWTAMALLDDAATNRGFHAGEDRVTSIYFASLTQGLVATAAANKSNAGMLYKATAKKIESLALPGAEIDGFSFINIFKTQAGFVATLSTGESTVISSDNGATFARVRTNLPYGLSPSLVLHDAPDGKWTWIGGSGVIAEASAPPSPTTMWTELWAPEGMPPTPNPVPPAGCKISPRSNANPAPEQQAYVSPDRQFIVYAAYVFPENTHQLCISKDGGHSFAAHDLAVPVTNKMPNGATGVTFNDANNGFVFAGSFLDPGGAYIQRTTDAGSSWKATTLPASVTAATVDIHHVFFAPDGMHGFAVGWFASPFRPLLLVTSDAGATWAEAAGSQALKTEMDKLRASKLYTGFALDAQHIWVGGERGSVFASETAGN